MSVKTDGQVAFEAYATAAAGKTHDGRSIPAWENVGEKVQAAWEAAAAAVLARVFS